MPTGSHPIVELAASCACGRSSISVNGQVKAMLLCACEACQKATGTGHATVAMVAREAVTVGGETTAFTRPADSGATFTRHFCPVCAVTIFAESSRAVGAVLLPVGLFGANTDWFSPRQIIFAQSHRDWDQIAADLPRRTSYSNAAAEPESR
jgi:hypothetical protein